MKPRSLLIIAAVAAACVAPAGAQTRFFPSIAGEVTYSDDLDYSGVESRSDSALRLSLDLPVSRTLKRGQLGFRYQPSLYRYQDTDELDRTDHVASFDVRKTLSRRSNLSFDTQFSQTQVQGSFESPVDSDVTLTRRTDRRALAGNANYELQVGPRWSWSLGVGASSVDHEPIEELPPGGREVEDREMTRFSTAVGRRVAQNTSFGLDLRFTRNRLDVSGDEDVHIANVFVRHRIDRKRSLVVAVGAFATDSMIQDVPDRSSAYGRLDYRQEFEILSFGAFAAYEPTAGGNLAGTATATKAGVTVAGQFSQTWDWDLTGVVARRDPSNPAESDIDSMGIGGSVTWLPQEKLGVRLRASRFHQSDPNPTAADVDVLKGSLGVVWFPNGRQGRTRE